MYPSYQLYPVGFCVHQHLFWPENRKENENQLRSRKCFCVNVILDPDLDTDTTGYPICLVHVSIISAISCGFLCTPTSFLAWKQKGKWKSVTQQEMFLCECDLRPRSWHWYHRVSHLPGPCIHHISYILWVFVYTNIFSGLKTERKMKISYAAGNVSVWMWSETQILTLIPPDIPSAWSMYPSYQLYPGGFCVHQHLFLPKTRKEKEKSVTKKQNR